MILIVTGLVFLVIGGGNLAVGRAQSQRPNAQLTRRLGIVGMACGAITLVVGIAQVAGLVPDAPPIPTPTPAPTPSSK